MSITQTGETMTAAQANEWWRDFTGAFRTHFQETPVLQADPLTPPWLNHDEHQLMGQMRQHGCTVTQALSVLVDLRSMGSPLCDRRPLTERPVVRQQDPREQLALSHLRGECHDGTSCPICSEFRSGVQHGHDMAIRKIAEG